MKSKILFLMLPLCVYIYSGFTQTTNNTQSNPATATAAPASVNQNIVVVEFDFATKKITNADVLSKIKPGDLISLHISNINTYLYQAKVAFTDSTIAINTAPSLFSSYFSSADISSLVANLGSSILKIFPPVKPPSQGVAYASLPANVQAIMDNISKEMQTLKNKLQTAQLDLNALVEEIQAFVFKAEVRMLVVKQWNIHPGDVKDFDLSERQSFIDDLNKFVGRKNKINKNVNDAVGNYEANTLLYGKYISDDTSLKQVDSQLKASSKDLYTALSSFDTTYSYSKFTDILSQLINIQKDNFEYTSLPAQINGDLTKVDVDISPWSSSSTLSSYKATWQFPPLQRTYFNFSMDFYVSGLHSENYFANTKVTGTDTTFIIGKENSSQIEVGISALFHYGFYCKNNNRSFQFCFGPGLSIQKSPQPRLLAGFGAGFGRKNKLMLNVGVIVGEVQTLRDYYKSNPVVTFPPSDLTVGVLKANAFFSVGYVIF